MAHIIPFRKVKGGLADVSGGPYTVALARQAGAFFAPAGPMYQPWLELLPHSLFILVCYAIPAAYFQGNSRDELIASYTELLSDNRDTMTKGNLMVAKGDVPTKTYRRFLKLLASTQRQMPHDTDEALNMLLEWGLLQQYGENGKLVVDYALPWPETEAVFPMLNDPDALG